MDIYKKILLEVARSLVEYKKTGNLLRIVTVLEALNQFPLAYSSRQVPVQGSWTEDAVEHTSQALRSLFSGRVTEMEMLDQLSSIRQSLEQIHTWHEYPKLRE